MPSLSVIPILKRNHIPSKNMHYRIQSTSCNQSFFFNSEVAINFVPNVSIPPDNITAQKKPVTTMLTYSWKCTVLHCNHLGNTWKPLVLMTRHFDYCPSASEGDNQSVRSSAPVVSRCFPGGYNVKLYISRGRLAWWLLAFLHSVYYLLGTLSLWTSIHINFIHYNAV